LPREVFLGRFGVAGVFFSVWASDFGRFFPATSGTLLSAARYEAVISALEHMQGGQAHRCRGPHATTLGSSRARGTAPSPLLDGSLWMRR
jgi:hypothetical protein